MPPSEGQKSQAGVVASLRGGRVEECAEPFVDLYLLMKTSPTGASLMPRFSKRVH